MRLAPRPTTFVGNIRILKLLMIAGFLIVGAGYYRIQVLQQERYEALGEKCRIIKRRIKATRGLIYDRNDRLITQNMPTYNLVLLRDEMKDSWRTLKPQIAQFVSVDPELLQERYNNRSHLFSESVLLKENIDFNEAIRIRRNLAHYQGLGIETVEKRHYSYGQLFSHCLGYVGEADQDRLHRNPNLHMGDIVGKSGIESIYNDLLTGQDGEVTLLIDNLGGYRSKKISRIPQPGADLVLTIDFELQRQANELLAGRRGAVVMMDVHRGEILAFVSSPSFDLNQFTRGLSQQEWDSMVQSPGEPFLVRPIQGSYAPGSIFKLVTALAALRGNKVTPATRHYCSGSLDYFGRVFHCHNRGGHGSLDLMGAIQNSCNLYFYQVAKDMDVNDLAKMAQELGLGTDTRIDLGGEKPGLVPTPDWKKARFGQIWYPGETLSFAIGQGSLQVTPLQLAVLMANVATEGWSPTPHLLHKTRKANSVTVFEPEGKHTGPIPAEYYDLLKTAMWKTVNGGQGTGSRAMVEGFDVCGKTGTAQLVTFTSEADYKNHSYQNAWFAGFAPRDNPQIAVVVLVEQAGAGGDQAAPLAGKLFKAYKQRIQKVDPS